MINAYFVDEYNETLHFILENSGISISFKYFYAKKNITQKYEIVLKNKRKSRRYQILERFNISDEYRI